MSRITQVTIKGFQSHISSTFKLAPGLTVITGPSDAGKTAVIRGIRWVAFNEPQGEGFLFTLRNEKTGEIEKQAEVAEVTIGFENGVSITKTRRKGKTSYRHSAFAEPWEKAEVPQEIKDALGLYKQTYGENFETYLNFAYQLEAPFVLSETSSVGAKILGKLAGTEVVDKAIAAISKNTHKTREEIRTADKEINEKNIDLLDYMGIDDLKQQVESCEAFLEIIETNAKKVDLLTTQYGSYSAVTSTVAALDKKLESLSVVETLAIDLVVVEKTMEGHEKALYLLRNYDKVVQLIKDLSLKLDAYSHIEEAALLIKATDLKEQNYEKLAAYKETYRSLVETINSCDVIVERYKKIGDAAKLLVTVDNSNDRLTNIKNYSSLFNKYSQIIITTSDTLDKTKDTDRIITALGTLESSIAKQETLKLLSSQYINFNFAVNSNEEFLTSFADLGESSEILKLASSKLNQLSQLQQLQADYKIKNVRAIAFIQAVDEAASEYDAAQIELTKAWEAAGDICPLCEQPVSKGVTI